MHVCCASARALYASEAVSTATASPHYQQVAGTVRGEGAFLGWPDAWGYTGITPHPPKWSVCLSVCTRALQRKCLQRQADDGGEHKVQNSLPDRLLWEDL